MQNVSDIAPVARNTLSNIRYLRQPEVLARVGVTWITLLRWEKKGQFPKRCKIGERVVAWVESEIDEWCASRANRQNADREVV